MNFIFHNYSNSNSIMEQIINLFIRETALIQLINCEKQYELRLERGIFTKMNEGDKIFLCNGIKKIKVLKKIDKIYKFNNIKELLLNLGVKKCLPLHTLNSGIKYFKNLYKNVHIDKYNVVAIKFC